MKQPTPEAAHAGVRVDSSSRVTLPARENSGGGAWRRLSRNAIGSFVLKVAAAGFTALAGILLARCLGTEGYGVYAYAAAWINLLVVPATLGLDRLLVRQVAVESSRQRWGVMRGLVREAHAASLSVAVCLSLCAGGIAWWATAAASSAELRRTFLIALLSLPLLVLTNLRQAIAQGLNRVVLGQMPEMLLRPVLLVLLVGAAYALSGARLAPSTAMGMNVLTTGVAFLVGAAILRGIFPKCPTQAEERRGAGELLRRAFPLLLIGGLFIIDSQAVVLMLGVLRDAKTVGIYSAAARTAELISFALIAVNAALAPNVASLWAAGEVERLQRIVTRSVRLVVLAAAPVVLALVLFGRAVLSLFGAEFAGGHVALSVLSIGYLVNAAMGSAALLLIMTNHEGEVIAGYVLSVCSMLALGALLMPLWGIEGAAVTQASGFALWNVFLAVRVWRRLGIRSAIFG